MKSNFIAAGLVISIGIFSVGLNPVISQEKEVAEKKVETKTSLHQFQMNDIHGKKLDFSKFKGKTVLMVNVASKCGFTHHYEGLQKLHNKYHTKGLVIVGVPCNQFGGQEPGSNLQILEFCKDTYDVSFPLTNKIKVKGDKKHEVFKFLTKQKSANVKPGEIKWNFEKFILDGKGKLIGRFSTRTKPDNKKLVSLIEKSIASK